MTGPISEIRCLILAGLLLCGVLPPNLEAAQRAGPDRALTLGKAIKVGLENNPQMMAARSQVDASEARITHARSGFFPQVDLSESFSRTNNPTLAFSSKLNQGNFTSADFDPAKLNDPNAISNFTTTLSATLPVYDRGRTRIGLTQAKLDNEAVSLLEDHVRQRVLVDVVTSYVGVLLAQENLGVVHQTLETARAHLKMVRSRYESGLVVKSDFLRAEVRIAQLEQERVQAQSEVEIARAALNGAMGVDIDRSFDLVTPLEQRAETPGPLETWIEKSLKYRPDLRQIQLQVTIAEEEVKKAKSAHLPGLYLSGNYELDSEKFDETADNYTLGAMVQVNLFSGLRLQSKVHEAMAKLRQVQAMIRQKELGIRVETRRAFFEARSAYERIGVAQAAVAQAEEALRIVRNRYGNGLMTIVDLLDAEVAFQQARTNHLRSLHDYKVAMAQLQLAAGTINESFQ